MRFFGWMKKRKRQESDQKPQEEARRINPHGETKSTVPDAAGEAKSKGSIINSLYQNIKNQSNGEVKLFLINNYVDATLSELENFRHGPVTHMDNCVTEDERNFYGNISGNFRSVFRFEELGDDVSQYEVRVNALLSSKYVIAITVNGECHTFADLRDLSTVIVRQEFLKKEAELSQINDIDTGKANDVIAQGREPGPVQGVSRYYQNNEDTTTEEKAPADEEGYVQADVDRGKDEDDRNDPPSIGFSGYY